jgi:repressor LexA
MDFKDVLKNRRSALHLTLDEIAEAVGVSKATVSRWESGEIANLRRDKIARLAKALRLSPAVLMGWEENSESSRSLAWAWAEALIDAYTAAPEPTQENVCTLLRIDHVVPDALSAPAMCEMIVFDYPAAAGLPLYAESDFERVEFPEGEVPAGADFGIRISGDSMRPTIEDGCVVWVHKQTDIRDGEIGIFTLADSAVCKRARLNGRGGITQLESDNPAYAPITGSDLEDLRVVGKVLL